MKEKLCFATEIRKVYSIVRDDNKTLSYFEEALRKSVFSIKYTSFEEALIGTFDYDNDYFDPQRSSFWYLINYTITYNVELTLNSFLDYLELFKTLLDYKSNNTTDYISQIERIIDFDCEKIGYCFVKNSKKKYYSVRQINPEAEAVALQVKESVRDKIYKYLMIREGKSNDKRECIKSLSDDVEVICNKKNNNPSEYDKLRQFIQCVRHTKDKPKKEFPFYYEDEEKWLDKTFDMIIGILAFTKTKEIVAELTELEKEYAKKQQ